MGKHINAKYIHRITNVKDGYGDCSHCGRVIVKPYHNNNPNPDTSSGYRCSVKLKEIYRRLWFRRRYGIELGDTGVETSCVICGGNNRIALDHNHETQQLRGWLCVNCNMGIGHFKDDTQLLYKAIEYINKYTSVK